jgi:hypothetical protein
MTQNFIKLSSETEEFFINPHMISMIKRNKENVNVIVFVFGYDKPIRPIETYEEIIKKIDEAGKFKFTM